MVDEIIPRTLAIGMDGGWLPHWDEALDESTGIIEAVYFAPYLYGGEAPLYLNCRVHSLNYPS